MIIFQYLLVLFENTYTVVDWNEYQTLKASTTVVILAFYVITTTEFEHKFAGSTAIISLINGI